MKTPAPWRCPYCGQIATITNPNITVGTIEFDDENKDGPQELAVLTITCPNDECREYTIKMDLFRTHWNGARRVRVDPSAYTWHLRPAADMKALPAYVPQPIVADYEEACLIRHLSAKASATLARRCLQGMIRDFWGISKGRLIDEINAIEDKVDPVTWNAIDAVRQIGNIGAHMEKDINVIVDVDSQEAGLLIGLIEMLIEDWYVAKHEREQRLVKIIEAAADKKEQRADSNLTA